MSVLPWPGVSAWPAPRAKAVDERQSEARAASGRPRGRSPAARRRPAGTRRPRMAAPPAGSAAAEAASPRADGGRRDDDRGRADVERLAEEVRPGRSSARRDGLVVGSPPESIATPSPVATISRQPIRSGYDGSSNVTVARSAEMVAAAQRSAHSIRIVERPPRPGGKAIEADVAAQRRSDAVDGEPQTASPAPRRPARRPPRSRHR